MAKGYKGQGARNHWARVKGQVQDQVVRVQG